MLKSFGQVLREANLKSFLSKSKGHLSGGRTGRGSSGSSDGNSSSGGSSNPRTAASVAKAPSVDVSDATK